jgi:hypothetical protein
MIICAARRRAGASPGFLGSNARDRPQPVARREFLKEFRAAVSDRIGDVRCWVSGRPLKGTRTTGDDLQMQYLMSVITDTAGLASPEEMAAIDTFNDRLVAEDYWVFAGGLAAPSSATVIDNRGREAIITDGPFLESKEFLIGFWIIEAADLDVALKLAADGSKACNRKVEVRPFL